MSRDRHALERFEREAQAASALNHPNICTIYDIDEHEGQRFIAMEYLEGRTLRQRIEGEALHTNEILDLAIQVANGLGAAHSKGIIHRDIYALLLGAGSPLRLTSDPADDFAPAWSPDGKFIAFLRTEVGSSVGLFVIPALGGAERHLTQLARNYPCPSRNLAWSPDSRWVVAPDDQPAGESTTGHAAGLFLVSVESGERIRLTSVPGTGGATRSADTGASFSADGRSLAFVRFLSTGTGDIYRLSLTDDYRAKGEPERLTYDNREVRSPVWTSDGSEILYSSGALHGGFALFAGSRFRIGRLMPAILPPRSPSARTPWTLRFHLPGAAWPIPARIGTGTSIASNCTAKRVAPGLRRSSSRPHDLI